LTDDGVAACATRLERQAIDALREMIYATTRVDDKEIRR